MFDYNYHDSSHLMIDNSRIKNVTAKLPSTFVLSNLVKAVCKFQVIWIFKKKMFFFRF